MEGSGRSKLPFSGLFTGFNSLSERKTGMAVLILFVMVSSAVAVFHEPWLDEAQSWLIARDASYSDMLFKLPHVEGHVPLWWLILSIPAKLGVPYETGLKAVNIIISASACAVFLFRSPFPNAFKAVMPFTYFFMYQYTVIARPYMLVTLALFLAADSFKTRGEHPVRTLLSLILLCLADTFGIAIAGGIAAAWVIDLIRKRAVVRSYKQVLCLAALLAAAILLMLMIWPTGNSAGMDEVSSKPVLKTFLMEILMLPSELCITSMTAYGPDAITGLSSGQLLITSVISILLWAALAYFFVRRDILPDIFLPFLTLMIFGALYIYLHHFGLFLMTGIYAAWISLSTRKDTGTETSRKELMRWLGGAFCSIGVVISIMWTCFASVNDINHPYWISRDLYDWIEENSLEDRKWFATWDLTADESGTHAVEQNTAVTREATPVNPYLKGTKPLNFNNEGVTYAIFASNPDSTNEADIASWKSMGEPDLILCSDMSRAAIIMQEMGYGSQYDMAYIKECRTSWKDTFTKGGVMVLIRRDSGISYRAELSDLPSIMGQG